MNSARKQDFKTKIISIKITKIKNQIYIYIQREKKNK